MAAASSAATAPASPASDSSPTGSSTSGAARVRSARPGRSSSRRHSWTPRLRASRSLPWSPRAGSSRSEARLQLALAEEIVRSSERTLGLANDRLRVGKGDEYDVTLAQANTDSLRDAARQLVLGQQQALRALETLLGRYPAAAIATASTIPAMPPPVPAGLPSELLERRPDVIARRRRLPRRSIGLVRPRPRGCRRSRSPPPHRRVQRSLRAAEPRQPGGEPRPQHPRADLQRLGAAVEGRSFVPPRRNWLRPSTGASGCGPSTRSSPRCPRGSRPTSARSSSRARSRPMRRRWNWRKCASRSGGRSAVGAAADDRALRRPDRAAARAERPSRPTHQSPPRAGRQFRVRRAPCASARAGKPRGQVARRHGRPLHGA